LLSPLAPSQAMGQQLGACVGERDRRADAQQPSRDLGWCIAARSRENAQCLGRPRTEAGTCWARTQKTQLTATPQLAGDRVMEKVRRYEELNSDYDLWDAKRGYALGLTEKWVSSPPALGFNCPEDERPLLTSEWLHVMISEERGLMEKGFTARELLEAFVNAGLGDLGKSIEPQEFRAMLPAVLCKLTQRCTVVRDQIEQERASVSKELSTMEHLLDKAFDSIDAEGKGYMTVQDLHAFCGQTCAPETIDMLWGVIAASKTSRVTQADFQQAVTAGAMVVLRHQLDEKKEERQRFRYLFAG